MLNSSTAEQHLKDFTSTVSEKKATIKFPPWTPSWPHNQVNAGHHMDPHFSAANRQKQKTSKLLIKDRTFLSTITHFKTPSVQERKKKKKKMFKTEDKHD